MAATMSATCGNGGHLREWRPPAGIWQRFAGGGGGGGGSVETSPAGPPAGLLATWLAWSRQCRSPRLKGARPPGSVLRAHGSGRWATEEAMGEADVPAEQPKASQEPRVPASHVDPSRPGDHSGASPEGSSSGVRLIQPVRDRRTFLQFQRARRLRCGPLTVSFVEGNSPEVLRVAYAVGRTVGGAVERNQLRRRLRAIVNELAPKLRPGAYLIRAAPEAAHLRYGELRTTVIRATEAVGSAADGGRTRQPTPEQP
jgi:ribonuclease P protein component